MWVRVPELDSVERFKYNQNRILWKLPDEMDMGHPSLIVAWINSQFCIEKEWNERKKNKDLKRATFLLCVVDWYFAKWLYSREQ